LDAGARLIGVDRPF